MSKILLIFCWLMCVMTSPLLAQRNCATDKLDSIRRIKNPNLETKGAFEQWMDDQLAKKSSGANRTQSAYTIPVVVHIIHNGEPIGTGSNLSDAQVLSQISVLNKDFQRLNTDANQTPVEFQSVAGSLNIQFVLAKQDPNGNATNGINRVNGGRSAWNLYQDVELKAKSYWPAEKYYNVWVTNFNEFLGYAQFPVSSLQGLENSSADRLTDGVIIHYQVFGSSDDGTFDLEDQFNKGRTLTHETGHFLGLRHIWGDGNSCGATDYVNDTPPQIGSTSGCPSHPKVECASNAAMFQNYMDYTDDRCMNLFTADQFGRVDVVLANSPRRSSLLTSSGANPPGNVALDLGIVKAVEPTSLECSGVHTPTLTIRNFGTSTITSASIEIKYGAIVQTINHILNLSSLQTANVTFSNYTSTPGDSRTFTFTILSVNSSADEYAGNNVLTVSTKTAANASLPYLETFDSNLNNWNVVNPDDLTTWQQSAPITSGKALFIDLFDYENEGAVDRIFSPRLDISSAVGLLLKFKYAHAHAPGYNGDALYVYAQTGCADDLTNATRIFAKEGAALGTTGSNGSEFTPSSGQWKTQVIALQNFVGNPAVRLAFVSRNGFGNNIFIDSVELIGDEITDLVLQEVLQPSQAVCSQTIAPKLLLVNQGSETINGFDVQVYRNNSLIESNSFDDVLETGEETVATLSSISLSGGTNNFRYVVSPKNMLDDLIANNEITWPVSQISLKQTIPVRENFTDPNWHFISAGSVAWSTLTTNYGASAVFNAFDESFSEIGTSARIVSPQLDFTKAREASLFVDFSYAESTPRNEFLSIKVSDNCGETFAYTVFDDFASVFSAKQTNESWIPNTTSDWQQQYINMNAFVGQDDILVAIEVLNDNGNNLYVDNIEFFENDNSSPARISELFRVYSNTSLSQTYLTFNLEEQQSADVVVANMMGASIANIPVENALNQTLTFQLNVVPGIYIFRVRIGNKWYAVKQFIGY